MYRYWFYVYQDGIRVASGVCPTQKVAVREANHYAMQYSQDGEVTIKYRRTKIKPIKEKENGTD